MLKIIYFNIFLYDFLQHFVAPNKYSTEPLEQLEAKLLQSVAS
uniref:Uncharacterized protein n=1 Tax=Heterorhabditis bacteriophora TaxID=37862 RepID=A0A1I7XBS1_HETBA